MNPTQITYRDGSYDFFILNVLVGWTYSIFRSASPQKNSSMDSKILSFFSTQAGKEKIQKGCLSQTELFIYFYLIMLFDYFGLTEQTLDIIARTPTPIDYLNIWLFRLLGVIGLLLFYLANGGRRGNNFLTKFFTFSFTVGIKYCFLDIILEYLPNYFPVLDSNYYLIPLNILINIIMAINIGLRIYQTKT